MGRRTGRPNGRPKGWDALREHDRLRELVAEHSEEMHLAQIANATGVHYLVVRDKGTGKFLRVAEDAAKKLKPNEEIIEVYEKDPSVHAYSDLMDRTLGKPKQEFEHSGEVNVNVTEILAAARKRHNEAKKRG